MYHYYISRSWMLSRTAQSVYRSAAWLAICFFILLLATPFLDGISGVLIPLYWLAFYAGAIGTAITIVAMEYFLFGFDPSSAWKKSIWFLVMCVPPIGPAIYCLRVYCRSEVLDRAPSTRIPGMAEEFRGSR